MVPENDPVNPAVDVTLPLNMAGPIFVKVDEPDTINDPVICTCDPCFLGTAGLVCFVRSQ